LALTGLLLLAQGCDREPSAWRAAEASGQAADFEAYLSDHPEGEHAALARERLDDLAWAGVEAAGDRSGVQGYLDANPEGRHADAAHKRLEAIDWAAAADAHDAAAYQTFADAYPASTHAEGARRLAALVGLDGDWVFGGFAFLVAPSAEGAPSVEPVLVAASPGDNRLILMREVANVEATADTLEFHHTVTTESHTSLGVVINDRELISVDQDSFRSEYDVRQVAPNRLEGVNHEGYLGPGSTGFHDWDAEFLRVAAPGTPSDGLFGLWTVGETSPVVVRFDVDAEGAVALSSSPVAPPRMQGEPAEASYELQAADPASLEFSMRLAVPGDDFAAAYSCAIASPHELACVVRVTCSVCTETTVSSLAGRRLVAGD
jgi:hypothetical protein